MTLQKPRDGGNVLTSQCTVITTSEEEKESVCKALPFFHSQASSFPAVLLVEHGTGNIWALHLLR